MRNPFIFEPEPFARYLGTPNDLDNGSLEYLERDPFAASQELVEELSNADEEGRIIDLTAKADRSKRAGVRDPKIVHALVLHQMACCFQRKNPLENYLKIGAHFAILSDGRILQLHPISAMIWASNCLSPRSVAVEFAGNFPSPTGRWWFDCKKDPRTGDYEDKGNARCCEYIRANRRDQKGCEYLVGKRNQVTPAQIEAGRYLVKYLIRTMGLKTIVAHRQSSATRENDPGPDIWYHVGQWAVDNWGLSDGGPGFKCGSGNPIPDAWRAWGRVSKETDFSFESLNEFEEEDSSGPVAGLFNFGLFPDSVLTPLRRGLEIVAIRLAVALGYRDANQLTNLVFFARHAGRGGQPITKEEPNSRQLSQEWLDIRNRLVRPAVERTLPTTKVRVAQPAVVPSDGQVDRTVIRRMARYEDLIDEFAQAEGVEPNLVRGIIAAESGGRANLQARSGYKGLMQASTDTQQFEPSVSLRTGISKFKNFRDLWLGPRLKKLRIDLSSVNTETMIRWVMTAYNAGHVTVLKAVEYAMAAGSAGNWMQPEHFQRALLYTGAYSVAQAAKSCLQRGTSEVQMKGLIQRAKRENHDLRKRGLTVEQARTIASPFLLCAVEFKYRNLPRYVNRILGYKRYYDQLRQAR